jgi:hypothetical protein
MDKRATMAKINSRAADQQRHERWRELLARWQSSGLSQAAFCRQERIHVWQFTWWKKRLGAEAAVRQVHRREDRGGD